MSDYTEHYQLHQWQPQDKFLRTDFNQDLSKIDTALDDLADKSTVLEAAVARRGNCRICTTSYKGTGLYGEDHPCSITFPWKPDMVSIFAPNGNMIEILYGSNTCIMRTSYMGAILSCSWQGNTVSWYGNHYDDQLNGKGNTFTAVALGQI